LEALNKKAHPSILSKVHTVKKNLQFADSIAYDACLGYKPLKPPNVSIPNEMGGCSKFNPLSTPLWEIFLVRT
jgi:hypothetical protein